MGGEQISRKLPVVGETVGQLGGEAGLTLRRRHAAVERRRPDLRVIEVRLQLPLAPCRRFIRVHLDLEPVLSDTSAWERDRKSTRLNSSHSQISYAVFCLKKKKNVNRSCSADPRVRG